MISQAHQNELDSHGYVILEGFIENDLLIKLRERLGEVYAAEGDRAGAEFKQEPGSRRLANLVNKGEIFPRAFANRRIIEYVRHVLGPEIKLSSVNSRLANPNNEIRQPLHADMGAIADDRGYWVCNTVWMLDDFTIDNGPIRAIPGSHRWNMLPQNELSDPTATHPDEILLTGKAGTVIVMNAHLWHGGLENRTSQPRLALHAFYCRRDKPQQQYQKKLLDKNVQESLSKELRELLALDDPLNDQLCADVVTTSGFLK